METVLEAIVGPLAGVECRRSLSRGWVQVVRALAALPPALILLAVVWLWWFQRQFAPAYSPGGALVGGLALVENLFVTVALLLGPALLAGSLAGEKVGATVALLLTAQVSSAEIVMARLAGRLCVVGVFVAAGLPALMWFAGLCGLGPGALTILISLPAAVAFGGGGLALAVSAMARRGRDALLVVYLIELLLLLAPVAAGALPANLGAWIEPLNPYQGIPALIQLDNSVPALISIAMWILLGVAGCATATWRLRPTFRTDPVARRSRGPWWRAALLPQLGERPMIWKELYVAHVQAFSWVVRWLGILAAGLFAGASLVLAGLFVGGGWLQPEIDWSWTRGNLANLLAWSWLFAWFLQWALGLRAAAAIASERQHGTWDALMVSPLEGREIVLAKIYGSMYGLRGLLVAIVAAWVAGLVCGALPVADFTLVMAQTVVIGGFMLAVGTGFSLYCASPTRAMALTMACWIAAGLLFAAVAGILTMLVMMIWLLWSLARGALAAGGGGAWNVLYDGIRLGLYGVAAALIILLIRYRFDAWAGRCSATAPNRG